MSEPRPEPENYQTSGDYYAALEDWKSRNEVSTDNIIGVFVAIVVIAYFAGWLK